MARSLSHQLWPGTKRNLQRSASSQIVDKMPDLSGARLSVLPSGTHVDDRSSVLVESGKNTVSSA